MGTHGERYHRTGRRLFRKDAFEVGEYDHEMRHDVLLVNTFEDRSTFKRLAAITKSWICDQLCSSSTTLHFHAETGVSRPAMSMVLTGRLL
jgi:hypothetical protein